MRAQASAAIRENFARACEEVSAALERSGRGPEDARILVASKYYGLGQVSALAEAGADLLGENRAEDL
ncbi:MAG TPA: hypothetical protein VGP74_00350, partial [Rubrobacteraceae bacterium]|nr:hypothetical protein [Rubrobacteraceae bacterium]